MSGWVGLIAAFFKLASLVLGEIYEGKKTAREANQAYELDQKRIQEIFDHCLARMREQAKVESEQAGRIDDDVDREMKG